MSTRAIKTPIGPLALQADEAAVTAIIGVITEALAQEEKIQLVGFGSFEVKARAADTLDKVLFELSSNMKNAYSRSDM